MDIKNAIAKLELMEDGTIKFDNFDEAYQVFQIFLDQNDPTLIARLISALTTLREYEWVRSFLSEDIISFIEKCEDTFAKLRLYNTIIYLSSLDGFDERIVSYTNKLAKIDNCELPNLASSYLVGISTLVSCHLYQEAVTFADKLMKRIDRFGMPDGPKFVAYVACYKVYSNVTNPNIDLVNRLRTQIEKMLENKEFEEDYGDIYEFVKLEAEWYIAKKAKNLYKKKFVADETIERLIKVLKNKDLDISGVDYIFDILNFYISIHCENPLKLLEAPLFEYFNMSEKKITLASIYAEFYTSIDDKEKAFDYYRKYFDWMKDISDKLFIEKETRYKDIFKQAQLTKENETLHKIIMYDSITNCYSREYLKEHFDLDFSGTMLLVDVDGLKAVNDEFGHIFGDKYITYFANVLKKFVDKQNGDIYRFGGDEFVITLPTIELEEATDFITSIYNEFDKPHNIGDEVQIIKFSTGITIVENRKFAHAFNEADQALYKIKSSTRNKFYVY